MRDVAIWIREGPGAEEAPCVFSFRACPGRATTLDAMADTPLAGLLRTPDGPLDPSIVGHTIPACKPYAEGPVDDRLGRRTFQTGMYSSYCDICGPSKGPYSWKAGTAPQGICHPRTALQHA